MGSVVRSRTVPSSRATDVGGEPLHGVEDVADRETPGEAEADDGLVAGPPADRRRRADLHDVAVGQDGDAVGEALRLVHVVRGQQDRPAEVAEPVDQGPRAAPGAGVEPRGGLVEEQQVRVADQADGEVEAPPLPSGQRPHPRVPLGRQPDEVDDLVDGPRAGVAGGGQRDGLGDGQRRLEPAGLRDDPDPRAVVAARPLRVDAEHGDRPGVAPPIALQDLDGGRLAGPVRAEQGEDLPVLDREVDARDGVDLPVPLPQALHDDRRRHPLPFPVGSDASRGPPPET